MAQPDKTPQKNVDTATVSGFGSEWSSFSYGPLELSEQKRQQMFDDYFRIFPWERLPANHAVGLDVGCGSGRWAMLVAPRVKLLHVLDASAAALRIAQANLVDRSNIEFHRASVEDIPVPDHSLDFAYALGVLHHVPDTAAALRALANKLKPGAPLLVYLYYAFDNRPPWYRLIWKTTDLARRLISRAPYPVRYWVCQAIAALVYWPLARLAAVLARIGCLPRSFPLDYYRDKPFYVMRTDALDRFGTQLERRFSREEIQRLLQDAGFHEIRFSDSQPYWCATGLKR